MHILFVCFLFACNSSLNAADYTLVHSKGESKRAYTDKGLQSVHEQTQVIYLATGSVLTLTPPANKSHYAYRRWFLYENELNGVPSALSFPPVSSQANTYSTDRGQVVVSSDGDYFPPSPSYTFGGTAQMIACEQTNYTDYAVDNTNLTVTEPTLAQRILFDIRPASEMAEEVDKYKSTTAPDRYTGKYLEEYTLMAPVGATLNIGPAHQFNGGTYQNYYCNASSPQKLNSWLWYANGNSSAMTVTSNQFVKVTAPTDPQTITYTLVARTGNRWRGYTYYYIAKFTVQFVSPAKYGPAASPTEASQLVGLDLLYEETFNDNPPATTDPTYSSAPLKWKESTYGFYYRTLKYKRLRYDRASGTFDPYWSDYALLNSTDALSTSWFVQGVYNHGSKGTKEDAKDGYFLYVDGAQEPGVCFTIDVEADLCPGAVMYFSAWFAAVQSMGEQPQFDFALSGKKNGVMEPILTYATGVITTQGRWQRIVVPVELKQEYDSYHLVITNKADNSGGNDFIFDDFQIFASKPPVRSLQASNPVCVDPTGDDLVTYMRVTLDDQNIADVDYIYYQWADDAGATIDMDYYGKQTTASDTYGKVPVPDAATISSGPVYPTEAAFDAYASVEGHAPAIGFVKEEDVWVLYIATKANLVPDKYYMGYVATDPSRLRSAACGLRTELQVEGSMYMTVNSEKIRNGYIIDHCGNRLLSFAVERLYITGDASGVTKKRVICNADYLWGTPTYIDANPAIYQATFSEIKTAIEADRAGSATAGQRVLLEKLRAARILTDNIRSMDVYLSADTDIRLLMFTAFPIAGTGVILDDKGNPTTEMAEVCTDPVFGEVNLPQIDLQAVRIGVAADYEETSMLPNFVTSRPRVVRVSEKQRLTDEIEIPIYCNFPSDKTFNFLAAQLYATSDPAASVGEMKLPLRETSITKTDTKITLTGISSLRPGYTYTFLLREYDFDQDNCLQAETVFQLKMVPDRVVWTPQTGNNAWNDDENWKTVEGAAAFCPTAETDVILPAAASTLPVPVSVTDETQRHGIQIEADAAKYISYDVNFVPFACHDIYLPVGATLLNQHYLTINGKGVVDMSVPTNKWVLCSMPLSGGVSGDFWIPSSGEETDVFSVKAMSQEAGTRAADRLDNEVWQSLYNKSMINYGDHNMAITSSEWTAPLNALNTPYPAGMGIALWIENAKGASSVVFRLPKSETQYKWHYNDMWKASPIVSVPRTATSGKPAYCYAATAQGMNLTLTNYDASGNIFLFGNPTWAYIDMEKLLEGNPNLQSSYYVLTEGSQELTTSVKDISTDGGNYRYLAPMRGVLLQTTSPSMSVTLNVTPDMLLAEPARSSSAPKRICSFYEDNILYIMLSASDEAYGGVFTSRAVLLTDPASSNAASQDEDASFLLLDEWKTPFGVFTMSEDNRPLSINSQANQEMVPLCMYALHTVEQPMVTFSGADVSNWELFDSQTLTFTPLVDSLSLPFHARADGTCRYYLRRTSRSDMSTSETAAGAAKVYAVGGEGKIHLYAEDNITGLFVYDMLGRLVMQSSPCARATRCPLPSGVYMIRVIMNEKPATVEVLVR